MQTCEYKEVKVCEGDEEIIDGHRKSWTPFLRQTLISSGIWMTYFQMGLAIGTPTVLIPQLRREANSTDFINDEEASWISAATSYAVVPWIPILTATAWYFGRKPAHAIVVAFSLAGFGAFYFSKTVLEILICVCALGIIGASVTTTGALVLTEYTSPEYRGVFLALKSANFFWGVWMANAIGTFFHWKYIIVFAFCCSTYNLITFFAWTESPYWLASKSRIQESRDAFLWLRGHTKTSRRELDELMQTKISKDSTDKSYTQELWQTICSKWFYKPILLCALCMTQYQLSGKLVISVYAIDIIKKITRSESKAYMGMLVLDGVTVFGMYCGCYLARRVKRRVQLITGTIGGIVCLLLMSVYLHLIGRGFMVENVYISVTLLSISALSVSCGPVLLSVCLVGELLPVRMRNLAVACASLSISLSYGTAVKIGPQIFKTFGLDGGFLYFGLSSIVCLILLYKYLPETKDKTLSEISQMMEGSKPKPERVSC